MSYYIIYNIFILKLLQATSVVKDTNIPSISHQPVIRPAHYSKPMTAGPYRLSTALREKSFSPSSHSSGGSPIYDTIDPDIVVKTEPRNTCMRGQGRKVAFNSQDSETSSDELDSPPLVRYQTENGSIYTLPNCRRVNLQKLLEKNNTIQPSTPNRKYREGISSSNNPPSHKIKDGPSIQCKKALFEQFTKPDLLDIRNIGPKPVKLKLDHIKPSLRRMNTIATPSTSLIPPAPPPPPPPRPAASKPKPLSKKPSSDSVNSKRTLKSMQSEPLLPSSDKQPPWSPHGPTIAVPTAILAGIKQSNKTVPYPEEEFEETLVDQTYYSPPYSSVVEDDVPSMTHYAIPTAILAGITPPVPMRFESVHCGFLQRQSSIYNSAESLLEVEDGHSKVTYTNEDVSRRGSLTSAVSSPALLSGGKGEDNGEGKLRRIKNFFRRK